MRRARSRRRRRPRRHRACGGSTRRPPSVERMLTTFRGQVQVDAVRLPSAPPPADSDEWLEMRENQLEESLGRRGAPPTSGDGGGGNGGGDGGSKAASKSDAAARAQAEQLEAVAASVRRFVGGKGSAEGAQVPKAADVPVSLDVDRFMRALDGAFGGARATRGARMTTTMATKAAMTKTMRRTTTTRRRTTKMTTTHPRRRRRAETAPRSLPGRWRRWMPSSGRS